MRRSPRTKRNFNSQKLQGKASRKGFVLLYLPAVIFIMGIFSVVHGQFPETPSLRNDSTVSAMYVLGDSSVDCGDNTLFYYLLHRNLSLHPCNGSDASATLIPNLLAKKMGLPFSRPFYSLNGSTGELLSGVNFGSAQATIMNPDSQSLQSLTQQLRQVSETVELLKLNYSENTACQIIKSSIFYLSFGENDYIDFFLHNTYGLRLKHSSQEFANILVNQMIYAIRNLYDANARKIICSGIPPLGCTPRIVWEQTNISSGVENGLGCVEKINELVLEYNSMLDKHIVKLNKELPDSQLVFCDVYKGMMEIITKPKHYGFKDVKSACCGLGLNGAVIGCISMDIACDQASTHVWWDFYNPSQAVNSLLADAAWSGHPFSGICRPITVHKLFSNKV
ncbi:GDSL esterase/lipase [Quillaja saponaria]|uniref:GDSL esterase/lipase n=1 Tax=Quillaja saponaria TaxID=32244 RepID=A0AAD7LVB5_QUISA|nr:GDSL esterase/lipase [Quillaja saponaria]